MCLAGLGRISLRLRRLSIDHYARSHIEQEDGPFDLIRGADDWAFEQELANVTMGELSMNAENGGGGSNGKRMEQLRGGHQPGIRPANMASDHDDQERNGSLEKRYLGYGWYDQILHEKATGAAERLGEGGDGVEWPQVLDLYDGKQITLGLGRHAAKGSRQRTDTECIHIAPTAWEPVLWWLQQQTWSPHAGVELLKK